MIQLLKLIVLLALPASATLAQAPNPDPHRFEAAIADFAAWDAKNSFPEGAILFVGSSSIRRWPTALAFPDLPVINRGFGGAHVSDVNFYYEQVITPYRPATIVFYAGDNDIGAGKTPEQVLSDFETFMARVSKSLPDTRVLFLSIKPSFARWQHWPTMIETNELIQRFIAGQPNLSFVDMATPLLTAEGKPKDVFVEDGLHLNEAGNRLWQQALRPHLQH